VLVLEQGLGEGQDARVLELSQACWLFLGGFNDLFLLGFFEGFLVDDED
jgi:hypothetical protein